MNHVQHAARRAALVGGIFASLCVGSLAFGQAVKTDSAAAKRAAERREHTAMKHVTDATKIAQRMRSDAKLDTLLQQAKGVFLVPSYTRVALGVGAGGGAGVLLTKLDDGSWSEPAFYHVGAISVGLQVGAESGPAALLLNSTKALNQFRKTANFSLSADMGLTLINWSVGATGRPGDIVAWSSNAGLYGNAATVGVSDVQFSKRQTNAFYGRPVQLEEVLAGRVKTGKADALRQALGGPAGMPAATPSASSSASPSAAPTR